MDLMRKRIDPDNMEIIYDRPFTQESFEQDFEIRDGNWYVEDGWLIGESRKNFASMAIMKENFFGPVCLDFYAKVLEPCTHDINCMWSGSWNEETNTRALAYVSGIGGWWDGKIGFEKSPDYKLVANTELLNFVPGKSYHVAVGNIANDLFIFVDGVLAMELSDTDPIDINKYGRVGFEAFCTKVKYKNFTVKQIEKIYSKPGYIPEF